MKQNNIHIMGIPQGEENKQGIKNLSEETIIRNFPNMTTEKETQVQEPQESQTKWTQRDPNRDTS